MEKNYWNGIFQRRLSRRRALAVGAMASAGLAAGSMIGCNSGGQTSKPSADSTPGTKQPKRGGVLHIYTVGDPPNLDPFATDSNRLGKTAGTAWSRLLKFKVGSDTKPANFDPVPDLAESWEQPDDTTYVFKLRKGAKWHNIPPVNGREVTSDDVVWSYDRLTKPPLYRYLWEEVDSYQAVDKSTVKFKLKNAFAPFTTYVAHAFSFIMAREIAETDGDFKKKVIGTGPWIMEKYEPTVRFLFKKNPDYFEPGLPYMDGIEILLIPDASTQLAGLQAGNLDFGIVADANVPTLKSTMSNALFRDYYQVGKYIMWNLTKPPFNDVRIRRAVSMALDRDGWIKAVMGGKGRWSSAMPTENEYWCTPLDQLGEGLTYMKYDKEGAKKLLAEAGYPNGLDVDMQTTDGYGTSHLQEVELVCGFLKEVGIRATVRVKEYAAYMATVFKGDFDGMSLAPHRSWTDPDEVIFSMYYAGANLNQSHVNDSKLNDMIIKARRTLNREERRKQYWEIDKYIMTQVYMAQRPVGYDHYVDQPWVRDYWPQKAYPNEELTPVWLDK